MRNKELTIQVITIHGGGFSQDITQVADPEYFILDPDPNLRNIPILGPDCKFFFESADLNLFQKFRMITALSKVADPDTVADSDPIQDQDRVGSASFFRIRIGIRGLLIQIRTRIRICIHFNIV